MEIIMANKQENPNLIPTKIMSALTSTSGKTVETVHEIFTKINNAKDKPKKIEVLRKYDQPYLRQILKAAFDPKIEFDLPEGTPPFIANEAPVGTEHTLLRNESRKLYRFMKGGDSTLNKTKREMMFIQLLEGLHKTEADVLIAIKEKSLNKKYKGLTADMVKEALYWNEDFMRKS
jgi:hypothetical protein